jgi:hypothetical protein
MSCEIRRIAMSSAKAVDLKQDVSVDSQQCSPPLDCEKIREAAYYKWEAAGSPCGDGVEFWLAAEVEQTRTNRPSKPR